MTAGDDHPAAWRGEFSDGVTAAVQDVTLAIEGDVLVGRLGASPDGAIALHWARNRIRTESLGDGRVVVTSQDADGASLTVQHADAGTMALLATPRGPRRSAWQLVVLYGAGCVAVAALLYAAATPISRLVAARIPHSAEAALGQELELFLNKHYCETPVARATLETLARRLGGGSEVAVHLMDTSMVNAFTLPGGVVVVTRGLIKEAAGPDELAGVMAHELEHVSRRHVLVRVVRSSLLAALWQVSIGDFSGLMLVDPKTAFDIASLRFSRDDEREADSGALARLDRSGIGRAGFRQFFIRMQEKTDAIPAWLSSHPHSAERANAGGDPKSPTPAAALDSEAWRLLRDGCVAKPD